MTNGTRLDPLDGFAGEQLQGDAAVRPAAATMSGEADRLERVLRPEYERLRRDAAGAVGSWRDFWRGRLAVSTASMELFLRIRRWAADSTLSAEVRELVNAELRVADDPAMVGACFRRSRTAATGQGGSGVAVSGDSRVSRIVDVVTRAELALAALSLVDAVETIAVDPVNLADWRATEASAYRALGRLDEIGEAVRCAVRQREAV